MSLTLIGGDPGKCRVCGCSDLKPCLTKIAEGAPLEPCFWIDAGKTLCSNSRCVAKVPMDEIERLLEARQ